MLYPFRQAVNNLLIRGARKDTQLPGNRKSCSMNRREDPGLSVLVKAPLFYRRKSAPRFLPASTS